jgi:hypothetical protein
MDSKQQTRIGDIFTDRRAATKVLEGLLHKTNNFRDSGGDRLGSNVRVVHMA